MVGHYKVTFKDPTTGDTSTEVIFRDGQPKPGQVAAHLMANGLETETSWTAGSEIIKVEYDDSPEPAGSPYDYAGEAKAKEDAEAATVSDAPVLEPVVAAPSAPTPATPAPSPKPAVGLGGVTPQDPAANQ